MDDESPERGEETTDQPVDFADDLDQLIVVETELAVAEAELEALDARGIDTRGIDTDGADPPTKSAS